MSLSTLQMEFFVELFHPRVQSVETMGITMDTTYKKGHVKTGICSICEEPYEEDNFWIELKKEFFSTLDELYLRFRSNNVSYEGSADQMEM